jgi:hypothetical protein
MIKIELLYSIKKNSKLILNKQITLDIDVIGFEFNYRLVVEV